MNERIKQLAEQAGINIDSFQFSGTPIKHIVDEPSLKKFAELIVNECLLYTDPSAGERAGPEFSAGLAYGHNRIKTYLGSEE